MANSVYWQNALSLLGKQVRRDIENEQGEYIINMAHSRIWTSYDWRESIASLPPWFLLPQVQDYAKPLLVVPSDFYGLRQVSLVNIDGSPEYRVPLIVVDTLNETHVEGVPQNISYEKSLYHGTGTSAGFRLSPRPTPSMSCTSWLVDGTYKKRPDRVLSNEFANKKIPYDDMYFDVVVTGLQWAYAKATAAQNTPLLLQEFTAMIEDMAKKEGFNLGDPVVAPREPLIGPINVGGFPLY